MCWLGGYRGSSYKIDRQDIGKHHVSVCLVVHFRFCSSQPYYCRLAGVKKEKSPLNFFHHPHRPKHFSVIPWVCFTQSLLFFYGKVAKKFTWKVWSYAKPGGEGGGMTTNHFFFKCNELVRVHRWYQILAYFGQMLTDKTEARVANKKIFRWDQV